MRVSKVKTLIRNAKAVYVFEPLTEGYVQVNKSNYLLVLSELPKSCDMNEDIIDMRLGDLYIN